ncbi:adenosine kinase-like isoform X1 [Neodiprion fabricii]|uniref:adenosine kinase-like isoform X1 n=1 Tax=Neodiprion fabricii TaxID=2872261 RepID=UPI001ED92029|nr:adenosine kinase-like isoform X1 [Neodiprion fabricii]
MSDERLLAEAIRSLKTPAIAGFGNPLLDIFVTLNSDDMLNKYSLKVDGEEELPADKIQQLINELPSESEQNISPGGCAQNTIRVIQWLCGGQSGPQLGLFCGGLGNDSRGKILQDMVRAIGIDARYAIHPDLPTGVCVSMVKRPWRSLVANLGAASVYTLDNLAQHDLPLNSLKIIYIEGFFITHSFDVALELVKLARDKGITVAFNISGEYIFQEHQVSICDMVGLSGIVFGNAREMTALARVLNLQFNNVQEIPFLLNNLKRVTVGASSKNDGNWLSDEGIIVMTQGGKSPAIVVWGEGESAQITFQVLPEIPENPVLDTTGAGDSLVAGFLLGALVGRSPKACLKLGCKVASMIVTRVGVTFPDSIPAHLLQ